MIRSSIRVGLFVQLKNVQVDCAEPKFVVSETRKGRPSNKMSYLLFIDEMNYTDYTDEMNYL